MILKETTKLLNLAKAVAKAGGDEALAYFRQKDTEIENKSLKTFDPVTEADLVAEDKMRVLIKENRPEDCIIGEERGTSEGSNEFTWTLDPIDGTRAFISGIPVWTVLVSLSKNGFPILGVIYQPLTQEFFVGGFGVSNYSRAGVSHDITVRNCISLEQAFLSTTFPEIGTSAEREAFERVSTRVKLCRYGLDAYAYALLAAGHLDIVVEAGLKPCDVHAPIAVVEAAGGFVTSWTGGSAAARGKVLACGTKVIHDAALELLSDKL